MLTWPSDKVCALVLALAAAGQGAIASSLSEPTAPAQDPQHAASPRQTRQEEEHPPTAEDVLKALQQRRPANEVIPPASSSTLGTRRIAAALLPEGFEVVSRAGRLEADDDWWTFVADRDSQRRPMKLLPNAKLEQMVRMVAGLPSRSCSQVS